MTALSDMMIFLRKRARLSQQELADRLGLKRSAISMYETGKREPDLETLELFADFYNVDMNTLTGRAAPAVPSGFLPLPETERVPLLGKIACGQPILATENIDDYVDVPGGRKVDFCLLCSGDSMIDAGIHDGDVVFIHQQPDVENGEIAAVRIGADATLKRVYKQDGFITLIAENKKYPPFVYREGNAEDVTIVGKAVGFQHWY